MRTQSRNSFKDISSPIFLPTLNSSIFLVWLRLSSLLEFHIYFTLGSWSNHTYTYPKRVNECEREKKKYNKHIERDGDRNRGIRINREGGKKGRRKWGKER